MLHVFTCVTHYSLSNSECVVIIYTVINLIIQHLRSNSVYAFIKIKHTYIHVCVCTCIPTYLINLHLCSQRVIIIILSVLSLWFLPGHEEVNSLIMHIFNTSFWKY